MKVLGLDHVQLAAPPGCEAAARRFYGEVLGLGEIEKPAALRGRGGVWFVLADGRQLHIGVVAEGFVPALKAHPALLVGCGELDALAAALEAGAFAVRWDAALPARRLFTADPWGNRIELLEQPGESW